MKTNIRRQLIKSLLASFLITCLCACSQSLSPEPSVKTTPDPSTAQSSPNIQRIKIATVGTPDVDSTKALYNQWLDYQTIEEDVISAQLATSWGAPEVVGRPYAVMQGTSGDDVFLRAIEVALPENYQAMTTYGWNAIEFIVEDPDVIYHKLLDSPFTHIGGPANLGDGMSSIRAVQFKGPSEEVFYFTTETGDRSKSTLLTPRADIDRPFIMVVAGPDVRALTDFYTHHFGAIEAFVIETPINILASAQNLPSDHIFEMGFVRLAEFSNAIEIDGYPQAGPRPTIEGDLPGGVSITSFSVADLNTIDPDLFIAEPVSIPGKVYAGNRTATIVGPAGELIELIEEK